MYILSCRPTEIPFYIGLVTPFVIAVLCNIFILAIVYVILKLRKNETETSSHVVYSILLTIMFGIGWMFGLAFTGTTGVAANVTGSLFIITGAPLGLYIFLIYRVNSSTVRGAWKNVCFDMKKMYIVGGYSYDKKPIKKYVKHFPQSDSDSRKLYMEGMAVLHNPTVSFSLPDMSFNTEMDRKNVKFNDDIDAPDPSEETPL